MWNSERTNVWSHSSIQFFNSNDILSIENFRNVLNFFSKASTTAKILRSKWIVNYVHLKKSISSSWWSSPEDLWRCCFHDGNGMHVMHNYEWFKIKMELIAAKFSDWGRSHEDGEFDQQSKLHTSLHLSQWSLSSDLKGATDDKM